MRSCQTEEAMRMMRFRESGCLVVFRARVIPNPGKIVIVPKQWSADGSLDTPDLFPAAWVKS